ncbi:MAG: hypothetical protein JST89_08660 [Cyanobacteria bacterium SZAS-4]|nr:hypothetical protein [Cyanobacteria bacterium SZAS-4]
MGILFHRRAERLNCNPAQVECEQNVCTPEDPRTQYMEMRNQCNDATDRNCVPPRQFAPASPAPGPYIPSEGFGGTPTTEDKPRINDSGARIGGPGPRRNPDELPPLTLTEEPHLPLTQQRDLFQYGGDGKTQNPQVREVPPPPLPASDLPVPITRDFYQYGDGRTQASPLRELPPPPTPINREYRVQPEPPQNDGRDHPGPGSMRRRSLRERLGLPERYQPHRLEHSDSPIQHAIPLQPTPHRERVREREQIREEIHEDRKEHRLSARLERIKEKLSRLTHLTAREKEQAFTPTSDEQLTLELINNERRRYRLPDVVQDPRLQIIASRHTAYQIRHGMTHSEGTPGWQTVSQRMNQVGLEGWRENAASGAFNPQSLVRMWMNSPGHRAAILGQGNIAAVSIRGGKATFNLTTDPELQRQG